MNCFDPLTLTKEDEALQIEQFLIMGSGPVNCSKRVMNAISLPILTPLHPLIFKLMDEIKEKIRYLFGTKNQFSFCISGSGITGMEAALVNLVEPNDVVLVCKTGMWGEKAADIASRFGAIVHELKTNKYGDTLSFEEINNAIKHHRPNIVFVVHADSSTGVHQRIENIGSLCRKYNALLIVDAVASIGGMELKTDEWQCDYVYGASQKCISSMVGITPVTMNERCINKIASRQRRVPSYYFDLISLATYWGCFPEKERQYHHSISSSLLIGFREALCTIFTEGLNNTINRHTDTAKYLRQQLEASGLELFVKNPENRLNTMIIAKIPNGLEFSSIANYLIKRIEISPGIGPTAGGQIIRIGVMGMNATRATVDRLIKALVEAIQNLKPQIM